MGPLDFENPKKMNEMLIMEAITLICGLIGIYVKIQNDLGKLKSRISFIEQERDEFRSTLKELLTAVQEIKIMLAKKGIDS